MHQLVGQFAVSGEQQQTGGVDVEPAHGNPACMSQAWQVVEYGGTSLRVIAGADFAERLVVQQHRMHLRRLFTRRQLLAVDNYLVLAANAVTQFGNNAVDLDAALTDPVFQFAARTEAGTGQHFLYFLVHSDFSRN